MTKEVLLLSLIALAAFLLVIECATEAADAVRYFFYKGNSTARVVGNEPFSVSRSRGLVEQSEDNKTYSPVRATQDRNTNHPYIFSPSYWRYRKQEVFPVLEWETEGNSWKAHYPYARNWEAGSEVTVRYNVERPWQYAIRDRSLSLSALLKCSVCILCGILLILIMTQVI